MWGTSKSDYDFCSEPIGVGSYGQVFKAIHCSDGKLVAVKQMELKFLKRYNLLKRVKNELLNHARLDHENIVRLFNYFQDQTHIYLVMELCSRPLLQKGRKMDLLRAKNILKQLILGLQHLHDFNYVHRDIKPENIMLMDDGTVKILDLGLSCKLENMTDRKKTVCGTEGYLAPEIVSQEGYDERVDIFSLGCVLYKMLTGLNLCRGDVPFPSNFPTDARDLILRMTEKNPEKRIALKKVLKHSFIVGSCNASRSQSRTKQRWNPIKVVMQPCEHMIKSGRIDVFEDGSSAYSSSRDGSVCRFYDSKISIKYPDETSETYDLNYDDLPETIQKKYNMMRRFFVKQQKLVHLSCPAWSTSCLMTGVDPEFDFAITTADDITAIYSSYQNASQITITNGSGKISCDFDPLNLNHGIHRLLSSRLQQLLQLSAHMVTKCQEILKNSSSSSYPIQRSENVILPPPTPSAFPPQFPPYPFAGGHTYPYYLPPQPPPYYYAHPPSPRTNHQLSQAQTNPVPPTQKDVKKSSKKHSSNVNEFRSITLQDLASTSPISNDDPFRFLDDDHDDVKESEHSRIFSPETKALLEDKKVESLTFQSSHRKTRNRKRSHNGVMKWPNAEEVYFNRIKNIYESNSKQISKSKLYKKFKTMRPHAIYLRVCEQFKELPLSEYIPKKSVHEYYKEKIVEIYKKHNPSKLTKVLDKFELVSGEEIYRFFRDVCEKYDVQSGGKYILEEFKDEIPL